MKGGTIVISSDAQVLTGPFVSLQYRLHGPAPNPEAADYLMTLHRGHDLDELLLLTVLNLYGSVLALLGVSRLAPSSSFV